MTTTIVNYASASGANPTEPSGAQSGDVEICIAHSFGSITLPSGWTSLVTGTGGNGNYRAAAIQRGGSAPSMAFGSPTTVSLWVLRGASLASANAVEKNNTFATPAPSGTLTPQVATDLALFDISNDSSRTIASLASFTSDLNSGGYGAGHGFVSTVGNSPYAFTLSGNGKSDVVLVNISQGATTVTADVTATTKLSQVAGASVTVNTKLGLIHVKDVTASAQIAAAPHKDVAALAQVSHVQTKNLTGLTEISLGHTKDVTAAGKTSMAGTLDLSAALLIQNVFTLPRRLPAGVARIVPVGRGVARVTRPPAGTARIIGRPTVGTARSKPPGGGSE